MAIVSSLCIFAQPSYSQLWQKHLMTTAIKTIQQYLQYARTVAITKHTKITITPIKNNVWSYSIEIKDHKHTLKIYHFHKNLKVSWHGFGTPQDKIYILPNGMTYNNGHFIIQPRGKNYPAYTLFISKAMKTHIEHN